MRHKIFCEKPSFVDRKTDEKSRIGEVYTEQLQEIVDNAVPLTPKKATKFWMRLFNGTYKLNFSFRKR